MLNSNFIIHYHQKWFGYKTDVEAETPILCPPDAESWLFWKDPQCWERLRAGGEGDDRGWDGWMASPTQWTWVGWTLGVGDGWGGLACCGSWGCKESDMTEQLNWTELLLILMKSNLFFFFWIVLLVSYLNLHSSMFYYSWVCYLASLNVQFSSVQLLSCALLFATPWTTACQASLSITNSRSLLKLMSIELVMPSNHLILCHPLLVLPSIFPSIRVFSNESALHVRWLKYWSFSFNINPSNELPYVK